MDQRGDVFDWEWRRQSGSNFERKALATGTTIQQAFEEIGGGPGLVGLRGE
jgi:hypothetical protein